MPSLPVLIGVLWSLEEFAEGTEGPRQLPRYGRGPPGGTEPLAIRSQRFLLQAGQLCLAQHPLVLLLRPPCSSSRAPSVLLYLVRGETFRYAFIVVQGKRVERPPPKGRSGG